MEGKGKKVQEIKEEKGKEKETEEIKKLQRVIKKIREEMK